VRRSVSRAAEKTTLEIVKKAAYRQGLTTAALHTFIDYRAGKKVTVNAKE
jgi:hypothetical protein